METVRDWSNWRRCLMRDWCRRLSPPRSASKTSTRAALTDKLTDFLETKQLLLVLDNCEHLIDACARLVATSTARACPHLQVLATSREPLAIAQRDDLARPGPLEPPDLRLPLSTEEVARSAAVSFSSTARAVDTGSC
jgi:non-specific serine/threonine protein kinase